MMRKGIQLTLSLLLLLAIAAGGVFALWSVIAWFLGLSADTQTPLAALIGVVSVPVITYFTSRSLEKRRSRENAIREKKTEIYDRLIRGLMRMLNLSKADDPMTEKEMVALFSEAIPDLITYGSRKVILAWNNFRTISAKTGGDASAAGHAFEDLLKAMRNDLGHPTATTARGDLLRMFINDYDEFQRANKSRERSPS
ncbi:hypothetical protein [Microbacterium sp. CR_7]|uniref:hypothetical protein n=1 Tax=Microbacterium sp. CR_7 TaxID=3055792 RepID=UPI0035BF13F0